MINLKKILALAIVSIVATGLVGCSKPTAEGLKENIDNKEFSEVIKNYNKLEDTEKEKVDEYITLSVAELMTDYRIGERTEERKNEIIKEVEKLEKMEGASETIKYILEASKEVIENYYLNQCTFNTAALIEEPQDAIVAYTALQEACVDDPELLEKVNLKITEINAKLTKPVTVGTSISSGGFDITFNTFEFSYDVLPKNPSGFYNHYVADKGKVYYHVAMDIKNNNKQTIRGEDVFSKVELVYNNDYKYDGFIVLDEDDGSGFDFGSTPIKPLETKGIRILFKLPEEIETATEPVEVTIDIDGEKFTYKAR